MRMFVALVPPADVVADLERFLDPRRDAAAGTPWRFGPAANWHVTLAFLGDVDDARLDRVTAALQEVAARHRPFELRLDGAGCFGSPGATKHLFQVPTGETERLAALALNVRNGAQHAGVNPDGREFRPHLTVARAGRSVDASRWLRVLDTYASPSWQVTSFGLYTSHLGAGPGGHPRYERWEDFPLGVTPPG